MLPATYRICTEYRDSSTDIMTAIHDMTKALLGVSFFIFLRLSSIILKISLTSYILQLEMESHVEISFCEFQHGAYFFRETFKIRLCRG